MRGSSLPTRALRGLYRSAGRAVRIGRALPDTFRAAGTHRSAVGWTLAAGSCTALLRRAMRRGDRGESGALPGYVRAYRRHTRSLLAKQADAGAALAEAVGGDFDAMGQMQHDALRAFCGLQPSSRIADVGCGAGRLTVQLLDRLGGGGTYIGTDVVPELLDHTRQLAGARPGFRLELVEQLAIPVPDDSLDMVCFFSVMTHLRHEESFIYLTDAKRALKTGGRVVFSFLEFQVGSHWDVFDWNILHASDDHHLNQFLSRDAIAAWASRLGLTVTHLFRGDEPHIPLSAPVELASGQRFAELGSMGQSLCVLELPPEV